MNIEEKYFDCLPYWFLEPQPCFRQNWNCCYLQKCCLPRCCCIHQYMDISVWWDWSITKCPGIGIHNEFDICDYLCTISCIPIKLPFMIILAPCCCYKGFESDI